MTESADLRCAGCDEPIDCCEFCDRSDCKEATCFQCISLGVRVVTEEPHEHGG